MIAFNSPLTFSARAIASSTSSSGEASPLRTSSACAVASRYESAITPPCEASLSCVPWSCMQWWAAVGPRRRLFDLGSEPDQHVLPVRRPDELHADGQASGRPVHRDGGCRLAGDVEGSGEDGERQKPRAVGLRPDEVAEL